MLELDALRAAFPEVGDFRTALVAGLADAGYAPNEYGLNDVLLHTAIALDRVAANHPARGARGGGSRPARSSPADDAAAGPLAELLSRLLAETSARRSVPADLAHLTRLLETRAATRTTETAQADAAGRPVSPRLPLVRRIVGSASSAYLIDLDDEDFIERLALHVDNLVARASESSFSRNPLTASIKAAYPLIYELAVYIASELARTEGIAVNDDEIAYIAMHVGAYLDRRRSRGEAVRVAVSAPAYHDVHTVLAERIRAAVDDDVEVVGPGDDGADSADLVVAVLEPAAPVERLVVVAPFPTEADLERVRAEITRVRRARRRARLAAALSSYIAPELFVRGLRGLDRDGAIRMLGDRMIAVGVIDHAYVEGALERERLSSTAFTEHLAVPHAMTMTARRTAIAIAVDDVPIDWARRERQRRRAHRVRRERARGVPGGVRPVRRGLLRARERAAPRAGRRGLPRAARRARTAHGAARHVAATRLRDRDGDDAERRQPGGAAVLGGEHPDAARVHRDGVLPVRGVRAVGRGDGPLVVADEGLDRAGDHHRLDRHDEAGLDRRALAVDAVVEDRRLLVHGAADAVADVVGEDAVLAPRRGCGPRSPRRPR